MTTSQNGKVRYSYWLKKNGRMSEKVVINLTLISDGDERYLEDGGLRTLRLQKILRITKEAEVQGFKLGYEDLSIILLTSLATLKRDVACLEAKGEIVPLRGRRKKNGNRRVLPVDGVYEFGSTVLYVTDKFREAEAEEIIL